MLSGVLWKWNEDKSLNAFSSGDESQLKLPVKVICIGGLTDGLNACPWIFKMSAACQASGWNMIQPLLSSSYLGYGTGSLQRDTEEIVALIEHVVSQHACEKVVLVGHSTGCQNAIHFLRNAATQVRSRVVAVVLQAPVSDQEAGEMEPDQPQWLRHAREECARHGEAACVEILMPMHMHYSPITVSRFLALHERYGADDMFSSYLTDDELSERLNCFEHSFPSTQVTDMESTPCPRIPVLVAFSMADEYVPTSVDKHMLLTRMVSAMGSSAICLPIEGANHNLSEPKDGSAIEKFVDNVVVIINGAT
jgi:pimeloyl-ACP methyl ester carboxylesterase